MASLVYNFFGNKIRLVVPRSLVPYEFLRYWNSLYYPKKHVRVKALFHIKVKRRHSFRSKAGTFSNNHLLHYHDRRVDILCLFDRDPVKVRILFFGRPNPKHLFFNIYPFVLSNVLKRMGIVWFHAGSVSKNGKGVLISAGTGGGKTTTVISLIRSGFDFVTDDVAFVRKRGRDISVLGFEKDLSLLNKSISFFPELSFLAARPSVKKGLRWKRILRVSEIAILKNAQKVNGAKIKAIVFPRLEKRTKTHLEPLSKTETFLKIIETQHREWKPEINDAVAIRKQFQTYQAIAANVKGYELLLNKSVEEIPAIIQRIL